MNEIIHPDMKRPREKKGSEEPLWRQHFPIHREADLRRSRREFMKLLALVSGGFSLGSAGLAVKGVRAKVKRAPKPEIPVARIAGAEALAPGASLGFVMPDETPGLLVRLASGEYLAYDRRCTHLSCPVLWNETAERFDCPCHKGQFDVRTGEPISGPPQRALVRIALEEKGGEVWAKGYGDKLALKGGGCRDSA
jgi:Rieske Fe-S protein